MRWLTVNCIMLACIVTTLATEETRPKRDLQFWKDLIAAKLGLTPPKPVIKEDEKFFRIPGFEKVLVRAVPKVMVEAPVPERVVQIDPTLLALQSYLGTKTPDQTVVALQGVKNLLQSGLLTARQDLIDLPPPSPPIFFLPPLLQHKENCPEQRPLQVIQKTVIPMPTPTYHMPAPDFPIPRPIPVLPPLPPVYSAVPVAPEVIIPELRPLPPLVPLPPPPPPLLPVSVVPTKYSYKQNNVDGSVTSYLSLGNKEMIVTETGRPLPPPPSYIIDRFQKIIFGMPLGVSMMPVPFPPPIPVYVAPKPVVDVVVPPPIFPKPVVPVITGPGDVEVTITHPNKKLHEGMINIYEGTKITKPNTLVDKDTSKTGPSGALVQFQHISKLPSPPPELLQRFEKVVGKRPGMWGYSMKMMNGEGTYETINGGKIYYSHLLPGQPALPDPLSSQNDIKNKDHHDNIYIVTTTTENPELQPEKKFPPLPTPILGENEKSNPDTAKNDEVPPLPRVNFTKNVDKSPGFSYTQVNHDGTVEKITGDGNVIGPEIVAEALKPTHPAPVVEVKAENSGFSYTQINNAGVTKLTDVVEPVKIPVRPAIILKPIAPASSVLAIEDCLKGFSYTQLNGGEVTVIKEDRRKPMLVHKFEGNRGPTIVDVIRPAVPPVLVEFGERTPQMVHKVHRVPVFRPAPAVVDVIQPAPGPVLVKKPALIHKVESFPVFSPPPPPQFVDIIKPSGPISVKVGRNNGQVMFAEPVVSSYTYKQISHTNRQPFTVVPVGNQPMIEVPNGEVRVKVNKHHHRKPDGTVYPCTEVHMVPTADPVIPIEIPVAPIPPMPTAEVVSTMPKGFLYIPPEIANIPPPSSQKVEVTNQGSHFSYTQVSTATSTVPSTSTEGTTSVASESTPLSLSLNPIVVAPEEPNYSYTQTNSDGSSINIQGNKEQVHVNVNEKALHNEKTLNRGDIPDALA